MQFAIVIAQTPNRAKMQNAHGHQAYSPNGKKRSRFCGMIDV